MVPSIALELLLQKRAALPLGVAISDHQWLLEILDHKVVAVESPALPWVVVDSQSDVVISSATLPTVVDAPVTIIRSSASPVVDLGLQASGIMESFEAEPPDLATLEVGPMGAVLVRSRRSARLTVKCCRGTFQLSVTRHRLPGKAVSRRHMARSRSCSLRLGLSFVAAAPLGCSDMPGKFLRSVCCNDEEGLHGLVGCHK
jgi:hypothetical protein